jgi:hypothetical protein
MILFRFAGYHIISHLVGVRCHCHDKALQEDKALRSSAAKESVLLSRIRPPLLHSRTSAPDGEEWWRSPLPIVWYPATRDCIMIL